MTWAGGADIVGDEDGLAGTPGLVATLRENILTRPIVPIIHGVLLGVAILMV
jgi:hypothetical protein